ncbi:sialidase family protein [Pseudoxanthomonas sp. GW2]|uniref:sialidase family protein n=1 Tax=Pseudoxanthomonas sp. GW2 TaxID=1211114 RepID=UPI000316A056|nr:sialidase family protein [Pseudoxanthomonas sp. GW2]
MGFPARTATTLLLLAIAAGGHAAQDEGEATTPPYTIAPGLFDPGAPELGLRPAAGTRSATVFRATPEQGMFNNGAVPVVFRGRLYVQWQNSARDEDSPDTRVLYSYSDDGQHWSAPAVLMEAGTGGAMHSAGGWWADGGTLVAYINVWPTGFQSHEGGFTTYRLSRDGVTWSEPLPVTGADGAPVPGVVEQDPHRLDDGRILTAFHLQPGIVAAPFYTDDPLGVSGWRRGAMRNLPHEGHASRELEPSLFLRSGPGGHACAVMVFRDQGDSYRQLASESCDRGASWTAPVPTAMPDSRAKQSAGNLPDGSAFLVNAPSGNRERIPLAVTLSADGRCFDSAFLLRGRGELPALRAGGRYKRPGYHYPKSVLWDDRLLVAYAANKEDVAVSWVPVASLLADDARGGCPDASH